MTNSTTKNHITHKIFVTGFNVNANSMSREMSSGSSGRVRGGGEKIQKSQGHGPLGSAVNGQSNS